ncbi:hypothetical protein Hanom_Chr15g01398201 [Helianthus anomalus]
MAMTNVVFLGHSRPTFEQIGNRFESLWWLWLGTSVQKTDQGLDLVLLTVSCPFFGKIKWRRWSGSGRG